MEKERDDARTSRESEIPRENKRAEIALESVHAVAEKLAQRLSPVLRDELPVDNERDVSEKELEPSTDMGGKLRGHAKSATNLANFLQKLVDRLEL